MNGRTEVSAHQPVLLKEVLQYLDPKPGGFVIDGTVDGGGHARAIIERIAPEGIFLGVDWDKKMIAERDAEKNRSGGKSAKSAAHQTIREEYIHGNYADLPAILAKENPPKADGLLLDLGFSSGQLAGSGRGFSFSEEAKDEPLLMTYDDARQPAAEFIEELNRSGQTGEKKLADIIYEFGGERMSRRIAKAIMERERRKLITTSGELAEAIREALPKHYESGRIDPATRTFQALRIYLNDELGNLKQVLQSLPQILKQGGRVVIITFHSLEDRIVKQSFQTLAKEKKMAILTKKPVPATRGEIMENPRSRSAKLRAGAWFGGSEGYKQNDLYPTE